jgi:hypothetical protein
MRRNGYAFGRLFMKLAGSSVLASVLFWILPGAVPAAQRNAALLNVEGEDLAKTNSFQVNGGQVTAQVMGGFGAGWSGDGQLFWSGGSVGAVLDLKVDVPVAAAYALELYPTRAPDYGQIKIQVDGQDPPGNPVPLDAYSPRVMQPTPRQIGKFSLTQGVHTVSFMIVGKNTMAKDYLVGIDRIRFYPSGPFVESNSTLAGRASQNTGPISRGATNPPGSQAAQSNTPAGSLPQSVPAGQQNQVKTIPGKQGSSIVSGALPAQLDGKAFLTQLRSGITKEFMDQLAQLPQPSLAMEAAQEKNLAEIVSAVKHHDVDAAQRIWDERFGKMGDTDLSAAIFWILRQSYLDTVEDLKKMAEKLKAFNETKKSQRELLSSLREARAGASSLTRANNIPQLNGRISKIEESLSGIDREISTLENARNKVLAEQERLTQTLSQMMETVTGRASFAP